ncbi:glycoside hydrolase family 9 protein [Fulvivirga sediminis]|uniref:Glycoside hydrolase family 9 protein n=1 Tax=Fulvivirga sediminis TaxID=2803949 RepID=A0A937F691_9BACT|nr:glycoside hydrolase family 9 protein [Fulvivirga sediminis]MBL3657197.1 glycoside hydrolase family 9 protein [Fulvivirga sediminis]
MNLYLNLPLKINTKSLFIAIVWCLNLLLISSGWSQQLTLNDKEYFEKPGVNILVFSNQYNGMFFDEKTAGIELIHHGVRTATGGAVRLQNTPEQWDLVPTLTDRKVDKDNNSIEVTLHYKELDFYSRVKVTSKDQGVEINVYLDEPLPEKLLGRAGFNFELIPAAYFEKSYLADGKPGIFPLYPAGKTSIVPKSEKIQQFAGHTTFDDRGKDEFIVPSPMATGKTLILSPEDPESRIKITSESEIMLFDGRLLAQNGWFIIRSILPSNKTGKVLTWYMEPNAVPNWKRDPVIAFSQVGYLPEQEKVAVIELDQYDTPLKTASLYQVMPNGTDKEVLKTEVNNWGAYMRYNYLKFDFTQIKSPGLYYIKYGDQQTNVFSIAANVYDNIWHATSDVWFPVQMDHMEVNEGYRVWHGEPFMDDALQAPLNHEHFDGYSMGNSTDTKYKPLERIPNLTIGGWFDAGDFDIQTGSHCHTILSLVEAYENFKLDRDETFIDQKNRYVDIHRPDGKADILQQIEHGTLNIVAQVINIGHPVRGIVVPNLHQYHHLGDAMTETDNMPYNAELKPYETDGTYSGTLDDRWAFTTRTRFLDNFTTAALAAAHRALKGFNDTLSNQSLKYAVRLWEEKDQVKEDTTKWVQRFGKRMEAAASLELYITTKEKKYADYFEKIIWSIIDEPRMGGMSMALQAYPFMDKGFQKKLKTKMSDYKKSLDELAKENPYGVPISGDGWGGNDRIIGWATTNYYAHKLFPEIISAEYVYKGLNYIFGCHPYSNISFVSAVGTKSKKVTYGNNRADFTFIAGGVVPGLLLLKPDFPENKEDWPFFWGENEVTVGICADYILLGAATGELSKEQ